MYQGPEIVAEVKTISPFGWQSECSWGELFEIAEEVGDIISIHTDVRWGGSFTLLAQARARTQKPILAKGIHASDDDIRRAIDVGADHVLVVGRIPHVHGTHCWIEPHALSELFFIPPQRKVVWNSRNLNTGKEKSATFPEARRRWSGWLCQASFIRTIDDIQPGADAVLVGTHLPGFAQSLKRTQSGRAAF